MTLKSGAAVAIALAVCGLLAGCAAHLSGSSRLTAHIKVPPSRYVVCTSIVGCMGVTPRHQPATIYMSADGSLWAKDLTWTGWGTPTAVGHGTAEANNCQPDCAQGTFSVHPVTLTLTDPRPWHKDMAYARASFSIPSLHEHEIFSKGLLPGPAASLPPPASTAPPAPGPVSNQADVTGTCSAATSSPIPTPAATSPTARSHPAPRPGT